MDLSPEERRILSLASAARTPDARDKARVAARLAIAMAASTTAASVASSLARASARFDPVAQAAAGGSLAGKSTASLALLKGWVGGTALLTALIGGYLSLSSPPTAGLATRTGGGPAHTIGTASAPSGAAEGPSTARAPTSPAAPSRIDTRSGAEPALPAAVQAGSHTAARGVPIQAAAPTGARQTRRAGRPVGSARSVSVPAELELLHDAQAAWRAGRASQAATLLREHQRHYPSSPLSLERGALQVLTLCDLGDQTAARRLAHTLLSGAPHSPLRASIEQSCALK